MKDKQAEELIHSIRKGFTRWKDLTYEQQRMIIDNDMLDGEEIDKYITVDDVMVYLNETLDRITNKLGALLGDMQGIDLPEVKYQN